ncbi:helix-turn-helix domain-containing protein [Seongchinamella sediminis]|uniref:Helix-turn-helix domain-containing protein n=1 Tax=Seongchinamella sediminis TaxID=2283635 RepID=A0A3L7DV71_9GAMM|nr:AraC family transcriptional regulator [Seongchinamella sediminis]RLQ20685.1 helix-turn-helix domain-containing protein [Seongchinamella sediminis]
MASASARSQHDRLLYPSIPVGFLEDVLQAARHRKLDVEALLQANGLSSHRLQLPGTRISIDQYSRVLRQLRDTTADACMGFLSRPVPPDAFRVFAFSVVGCRNAGEVVAQANDFYALFCPDFHWYLEQAGDDLLMGIELEPALPVDYRFIIQSLLLMGLRLFGWLLGEDIVARSVNFSFTSNATDENLAYLFGSNINYASGADCLRLDGACGRAQLACNRDQVALMLKDTRRLFLVSRQRKPLSQAVRRRLLLNRDRRWLEIDEVAGTLGLNQHQLWRRLKQEGTSFLAIRDGIKRDWALLQLEDPALTIEQVATSLHYADVSAFRKAFRKWTGVQPSRYRQQLQG